MKNYIVAFFLLSALLFSCTKQTPHLTQAQLTAIRMQKDFYVGANGVVTFNTISISNTSDQTTWITGATNMEITNDGYIVLSGASVNTTTYNLEKLQSYTVQPTNNLLLRF